jgi:hypothetical protein
MEKKISAVEWLSEQMMHPEIHNPYIEQAKEMEKQNIINAYESGGVDGQIFALTRKINNENGEQYYKETYDK